MVDERQDPRATRPSSTNGDVMTTVGGVSAWAPLPVPTTQELTLTTTVNGVPDLVWDAHDELVLTEVPV